MDGASEEVRNWEELLLGENLHKTDLSISPTISPTRGVVGAKVEESGPNGVVPLAGVSSLRKAGGKEGNSPLSDPGDVVVGGTSRRRTRKCLSQGA